MKVALDLDPVELDRLLCAVELEINGNGETCPRGHAFADRVARRLASGRTFDNCASAATLLPVYRDLLAAWESLPERPEREVCVVDCDEEADVLASRGYPRLAERVRGRGDLLQ